MAEIITDSISIYKDGKWNNIKYNQIRVNGEWKVLEYGSGMFYNGDWYVFPYYI